MGVNSKYTVCIVLFATEDQMYSVFVSGMWVRVRFRDRERESERERGIGAGQWDPGEQIKMMITEREKRESRQSKLKLE